MRDVAPSGARGQGRAGRSGAAAGPGRAQAWT